MSPAPKSSPSRPRSHWLIASMMAAVASLVAACKSPPEPAPPEPAAPESRWPGADTSAGAIAAAVPASSATTPKAYRKDAATHLYGRNAQRIFKGKLPPLLYAIGVLEVHLDRNGRITQLHWMRAPRHAPEVIADIERTVRAAAPFPAPTHMGRVVYTDTWLWDKKGQFQLDTLTEGQL